MGVQDGVNVGGANMTQNPFKGLPERPRERIDRLLELIAEDWKRSGSDQRFFQYLANLADRLGVEDSYTVEDSELIEWLAGGVLPEQGTSGSDSAARLPGGPANTRRLGERIGRHRGRTPAQQAAAERRVKIEAAKLRCELDENMGRETPAWVIDLANENDPP